MNFRPKRKTNEQQQQKKTIKLLEETWERTFYLGFDYAFLGKIAKAQSN